MCRLFCRLFCSPFFRRTFSTLSFADSVFRSWSRRPGAGAFILNFCHSAMSIFGFGAPQIGCFSTKMQHLLPCRLHPASSIQHPRQQLPCYIAIALHILFGSGANCSVGPAKKELMSRCFSGCFSHRRNPKSYSLCQKGWQGAWVAGLPFACPVFRFIKCLASPCLALLCRMQLPIYFAKVCTSGLSRLFMGILFCILFFPG